MPGEQAVDCFGRLISPYPSPLALTRGAEAHTRVMSSLPRIRAASPTSSRTRASPLRRVRVTAAAVGAAKFLDEIPGFNEEMNRASTRPMAPAKHHVRLRRPPPEREKNPALQ